MAQAGQVIEAILARCPRNTLTALIVRLSARGLIAPVPREPEPYTFVKTDVFLAASELQGL